MVVDNRAWLELCEKWTRRGYVSLTAYERVWANTRGFIDAINDGGCISYFYNNGADNLDDCRQSLAQLGALLQLRELNRVAALFGPSVPTDIDDRNEVISNWDDSSDVDELLLEIDRVLTRQMADLEQRLQRFLEAASLAT